MSGGAFLCAGNRRQEAQPDWSQLYSSHTVLALQYSSAGSNPHHRNRFVDLQNVPGAPWWILSRLRLRDGDHNDINHLSSSAQQDG